ncbi:hypothetical protein RYH75_11415 [Stenotrophomonas geniculata]|uniref:hypothetical protein n=1 Tax=Stenotrophomonas geniculata TaxID=86188 RepID=UPI00294A554D|nr:hypothetical protein [Stenotrophomonas geniculata]MDV6189862.1 hypothetical protein [Stenotrophomonas geniculata]
MSNSIIATVQLVAVKRGMETTIAAEVFKHEVPILEAIHGRENVKVVDADFHALELPDNAEGEFQRLRSKYGERFQPAIDMAFPRGASDIARELDMELGRDTYVRPSEAVINSRRPERPGQKVEASASGEAELSAAELKAELTGRGIPFKGNASKVDLQALLDEAKKAEAGAGTLGG